jgi:hypothetical protein
MSLRLVFAERLKAAHEDYLTFLGAGDEEHDPSFWDDVEQLRDRRDLILRNAAPEIIEVLEALERFDACKTEQANRMAAGDYNGGRCLHVHWNGGDRANSCIKELFNARDALDAKVTEVPPV